MTHCKSGPFSLEPAATVGSIFRATRIEQGLSRKVLAEVSGVGELSIMRIERNLGVRPYVWQRIAVTYCMGRLLAQRLRDAGITPPWMQV